MKSNKRKIYGIISVATVLLFVGFITYLVYLRFKEFGDTPEHFRDFIASYGWRGRFVAVGIQILQIIIALIPGEAVEIGLGYAFGGVEGTIICYVGVIIASSIIFLLTKRFGLKIVEMFVSTDKLNSIKWLQDEKKLNYTIFVLYLIPGTPKDLLTYFVGVTKIRLSEFLLISSIARLPSVVSSTAGGSLAGEGNYLSAVIVFIVTALISVGGLALYNIIISKKRERKSEGNIKD